MVIYVYIYIYIYIPFFPLLSTAPCRCLTQALVPDDDLEDLLEGGNPNRRGRADDGEEDDDEEEDDDDEEEEDDDEEEEEEDSDNDEQEEDGSDEDRSNEDRSQSDQAESDASGGEEEEQNGEKPSKHDGDEGHKKGEAAAHHCGVGHGCAHETAPAPGPDVLGAATAELAVSEAGEVDADACSEQTDDYDADALDEGDLGDAMGDSAEQEGPDGESVQRADGEPGFVLASSVARL
jgi:hypothetical protein